MSRRARVLAYKILDSTSKMCMATIVNKQINYLFALNIYKTFIHGIIIFLYKFCSREKVGQLNLFKE